MQMISRKSRLAAIAAFNATAIIAALASMSNASAAPLQLICVITDSAAQPASQNQPFVVTFDQDAKTLQAQAGNQNYTFGDVSISNVAISGDAGSVSLGIDRSSLGMVWQQYDSDTVITKYGQCHLNPAPATGH